MTFRVALSMAVLGGLLSAADTPSPALLILDKEGALAIVDPASRQVIAHVRTGDVPHEVAASSDGRLAFVSNYGGATPGNSISVIDLAAQKELHRVDLGPLRRPHGLAVAGGKLYFTCETNQLIGRYDPAANQVDWLLGTGQNRTHMIWVAPDESRIYTANVDSNTMSLIDRTGAIDWRQTAIPVGKGPEGFDVSPDGKELWAANSHDGTVSIVDLMNERFFRGFRVGTKRSNRLKFTPDGRLVLISDMEGGELVVLERETKKELKRMPLGRDVEGVLVEPDSARAYAAVTGDDFVAVIDLKSLEVAARILPGKSPDGMAWAVRR